VFYNTVYLGATFDAHNKERLFHYKSSIVLFSNTGTLMFSVR